MAPPPVVAVAPPVAAAPAPAAPKAEAAAAAPPAAPAATDAHLICHQITDGRHFLPRRFARQTTVCENGDSVDKGQIVCMIEAMKLFNEIESDAKGKIVKVLVEDASPVEYDQPLFLVDPS